MKQHLTIPGRLPGWNQLNTGRRWADRAAKKDAMELVGWEIRRQHIKPVNSKAIVKITCYEQDRRRDPSNVRAGAEKIILDALQNCGIIRNDNWHWLADTPAVVEYDRQRPRIEIEIIEGDKGD